MEYITHHTTALGQTDLPQTACVCTPVGWTLLVPKVCVYQQHFLHLEKCITCMKEQCLRTSDQRLLRTADGTAPSYLATPGREIVMNEVLLCQQAQTEPSLRHLLCLPLRASELCFPSPATFLLIRFDENACASN